MSITISDTGPEPIALIAILAPTPPPDTVKKSPVEYKLPSLVIVFNPGIPVIVAFIKKSSVSLAVPVITSLIINVPVIEFILSTNSETSLFPITNFLTDSTTAVAPVLEPFIVLPTKSVVSPITTIDLKTFCVFHCPSDTRNICVLG